MLYWSNNKKIRFFIAYIVGGIILYIVLIILPIRIYLNLSDSLPERFFIVSTAFKEVKRGDVVVFHHPQNKYYPAIKYPFTKKVVAIAGDMIQFHAYPAVARNLQGEIIINDIVLKIKAFSSLGDKLEALQVTQIPLHKYFVAGQHADSYDSRYASFGLIDKAEVEGVVLWSF